MQHGILFNVVEFPHLSRSLGVYRIAHYLREQDLDIEVIDYANFWSIEQLQELFRSRVTADTTFIGFSHLFNIWFPVLEQFCEWVKTNYPTVTIVSGSAANPSFDSRWIDYYIRGFGEHAIVELLKYVSGNGAKPKITLTLDGRRVIDAIHSYPAFPMKSLMVKYQDRDFIQPGEWLAVEFARGCKFKCTFCNFPVLGVKEDYTRDAKDFELQMRDAYDRWGIVNYVVSDETFNDRTEKITKFADVVEQLNFDPVFMGYIRADLMVSRPQEKEELLRMKFLGHYYGIETFDTASGKAVGKGMDSQRIKQGIIDAKKYFNTHGNGLYRGSIGLIIGLPHESVDSIMETKQWLVDNWQEECYTVFPLNIPKGDVAKHSLFSTNYEKYGYAEMSEEEVAARRKLDSNNFHAAGILKVTSASEYEDTLIWKNKHMDFFQAQELTDDFVAMKYQHDFRPSNYTLAQRLGLPRDTAQRLSLNNLQFKQLLDNDFVSIYIEKKLGI